MGLNICILLGYCLCYICHVINLAFPFVKREMKHLRIIYFLILLHIQTSSCAGPSAALRQGDNCAVGPVLCFSNFSREGQLFLGPFFLHLL